MSRFLSRSTVKGFVLSACLAFVAIQFGGCSSREERAQSYYDQGMSYLAKQDYVKARIEFRNAVQLKGDMVGAWKALAKIDEHDKNIQSLAGSLQRVVELDPKDAEAQLKLARLYMFGNALDNALKTINAAIVLQPKSATALAVKAAILFRLKDTDGATQAAQKALDEDPNNTDASTVFAAIKFMRGDSAGALGVLEHLSSAQQDNVGVIVLKLQILNRMGNLPQMELLLRKLVALNPNVPAFRAELIKFYVAHNRQDDAINELRSAVSKNPTDTNAEFELVSLLNAAKGPDAARAELVARINAGGHTFPYQIGLAKLDIAQGKVADGTGLLKTLISGTSAPDDLATARTTLADIYVAMSNFAAAEPIVNDILQADGRNINGLRLRAAIRLDRGQNDDAIADLRSALNDQPQSPILLASLALAYEHSGSIDLADKAFYDATKAAKFAPAYGLTYVAFLQRRGMTEQAENVLTELASRNPNNMAILSSLAKLKLARQDWAGAQAIADSIHRLGDKSDIADQINGLAFSGQGKFNESIAALQNVYDANPGAIQPMTTLVNVYLKAKQIDKAVAFLQAALNANPKNAEALVLMGSVQLFEKKPDKAIENFEAAIKQQPKNAVGYRALADFYARQKNNDEALKVVRAGLAQQPKDFALNLTLAGLLEAKEEYEPAIAVYEAMLKDQPGSLVVINNLASLLADHRTDKASLEHAGKLAEILAKSQVPQFKDTLGWVAYQRGEYKTAMPLLEEAAAKLPNLSLIHYHLGMTYMAAGLTAKASEQFKTARDLAANDADLKTKIDVAIKTLSEKPKG